MTQKIINWICLGVNIAFGIFGFLAGGHFWMLNFAVAGVFVWLLLRK